jgi:hypothetical protein
MIMFEGQNKHLEESSRIGSCECFELASSRTRNSEIVL